MLIGGAALAALPRRLRADGDMPPSFNGKRRPWTIVRPPAPAPVLRLTTKKGSVVTTDRFKGRVILLNFWATWCPACLYELPDLEKLHVMLGREGLSVVPVNLDENGHRVAQPYFERLGIRNLPLLLDPAGDSATLYGLREGLPWSFLVDRQGLMQGYLMGAADWTGEDGLALLRHYLG